MNEIRAFIAHHEDEVQVCLYAVLIISLWFAEIFLSKNSVKSKWKHLRSNYLFILTGLPIQLFFTGFVILISAWDNRHHFGLVNLVPHHNNPWVYYISLFLMLDLCEYTYHVVMHKTEFLWKFHLVHHSDLHVDVSTTLREHPCETAIRTSFLMLWVFLCGPLLSVLVLRQTFQSFANILGHTEFRLSNRVNKYASCYLSRLTFTMYTTTTSYPIPIVTMVMC